LTWSSIELIQVSYAYNGFPRFRHLFATPLAIEPTFDFCRRLHLVAPLQMPIGFAIQFGLVECLSANRNVHGWRRCEKVARFQRDHVGLARHLELRHIRIQSSADLPLESLPLVGCESDRTCAIAQGQCSRHCPPSQSKIGFRLHPRSIGWCTVRPSTIRRLCRM